MYDDTNIFAKILRGEIPAKKVYEDEHVFAFEDIYPKSKVHILVIPKGAYMSFQDFIEKSSPEEREHFFKAIAKIARDKGVENSGYRLVANHGIDSHQEVPHFHMHILGGEPLGPILLPNV